jgi:hypothetical protein
MNPFEKKQDPMDALNALTERVREVLAPLGVSVEQFWYAPSPGEGPHMVQGVFLVDRDAAFKTQEERDFDAQFKDIALRELLETEQEKVKEARASLEATLQNLAGGFLDDPNDVPEGTPILDGQSVLDAKEDQDAMTMDEVNRRIREITGQPDIEIAIEDRRTSDENDRGGEQAV